MKKKFNELVKEKRAALKLTQRELADKSGVSRVSITRYEAGRAHPHLLHAVRLAEILDISLDQLKNDANILSKGHFQ